MRCAFFPSRFLLLAILGTFFATFFALSPASFAIGPPHKHQAQAQILSLEHQWRTAQVNNDVALMGRLLADDYLGIAPNGTVLTKTQFLDRMRDHALAFTSVTSTDLKIRLVGKIAIVTSLVNVQGVNGSRSLHGAYRYTRIYEHLPSGVWKITNFEATHVRVPHHHHDPEAASADARNHS